ncbi:MAG: polysaccharide deacetylase family protein [Thermodesulfobacteriota bacterium]
MSQQGPDEVIALRLDDVGACSKRYEVYSDRAWHLGPLTLPANWLFLKYLPGLRAWGPYREMEPSEWLMVYRLLADFRAKLTVAVTAAWPEDEHRLIPFPQKFPQEAAVLKEGLQGGLLEIANHGLTHCVLKDNAFKPRLFSSNRRFHREFGDWLPQEEQFEHLARSQGILQDFFQTEIVTLVPPGNCFTEETLTAASQVGLCYVSCQTPPRFSQDLVVLGDTRVFPCHDRDLVLGGVAWLRQRLETLAGRRFCFVKELGEMVQAGVLPLQPPAGSQD